jgi:hypothetical protein
MHESWSSSGTLIVVVPLKTLLSVYVTKSFIILFARHDNDLGLSESSSYKEKVGLRNSHAVCVYVCMLPLDVSDKPADRLRRWKIPRFITFQFLAINNINLRDFGLPSLCRRHPHSSAILHGLVSWLVTNISGKSVGLIVAQVQQVELEIDAIGRRLRLLSHTHCICFLIT